MATPRNNTYTVASGAGVYAGIAAPGGLPAWVTSMAARTWRKVPTSNTFMSIDPELRADMNPNFGGQAPWHGSGGHAAMLDAWCSWFPSQDDGRMGAGPGGGHNDLAGNYQAGIDLMQEVPAYYLIGRPSGALPGAAVTYNDGAEATGLYADGRVRANHNYHNLLHIPGTNKLLMVAIAAMYPAGNVTGPNKAYWLDMTTGAQTLAADYTNIDLSGSTAENSGACYDPVRNCVWHIRANTAQMVKIDLATGTGTAYGAVNSWVGGNARLVYVPGHDVIICLTNISGGSGYIMFNPATGAWGSRVPPALQGTPSAGLFGGSLPAGYGSGAWVPSLGGIVVWNNDSNTTEISLLTPPASNPMSNAWTWSVVAVSGSNTVTPPARVGGTGGLANALGKFGYLPAMGLCYWHRSAADDMYVFKL